MKQTSFLSILLSIICFGGISLNPVLQNNSFAVQETEETSTKEVEDEGTQKKEKPEAKVKKPSKKKTPKKVVKKKTTKVESSVDWTASLKWRHVGPTATGGRVVDIAVNPNNTHHILVASAAGGLWETQNNGTTWKALFENQDTISIGDIAFDPKNTKTIWVGSGEANNQRSSLAGDGIYKSVDGGKSWKNMGLKDSHHIGRVVVDPNNTDTVFVAAAGHLYSSNEQRGLYKTDDGGKSWKKVLETGPDVGVIDVVMNPNDSKVLLAASYQRRRQAWDFDGNGPGSAIYRSEDGGDTWNKITEGLPTGDIGRIGIDFYKKDPNIAYATVANQNVKKQTRRIGSIVDFGPRTKADPKSSSGLRLQEKDGKLVVSQVSRRSVAFRSGVKAGQILSSVAGKTAANKKELEKLFASARASDRLEWVFAAKAKKSVSFAMNIPASSSRQIGGEIYRSEDGGKTWKKVNQRPAGGSPAYYYGQIRIDPNDDQRIYILSVPVMVSENGGKTFRSNGARSVHVDHHALWINPNNSNHVMLGNDGGFHISYDRCKTWDYVFNIPLAQFYAITADNQIPYHVYGGLQDNGSWGGPSDGAVGRQSWYRVGGGDGFYVQVDPNDHNIIFSESQFGVIGRMNRATGARKGIRPPQSEAHLSNGKPDRYNWNSPILMSQHDPRVIYFGGNKLFMSFNRGDDWQTISPDLTSADPAKLSGNVPHCTITTIAESVQDKNWLMVGTDDGLVHISKNRGKTWEDVSGGFPVKPNRWWCSRVEFSRKDKNTAYVSFTGYREDDFRPFVFKTTDAGKTWSSISSNLPNESVNVIKQDPRNAKTLYVGTENGVYASLDDGGSWKALKGMPRVSVQDLLVHQRERDLIVGTHGRGIYIMDDVTPLQELNAEVKKAPAHLFSVNDWYATRPSRSSGFAGDRKFTADSSTFGAAIWYALGKKANIKGARLWIEDVDGKQVSSLTLQRKPGLHKAYFRGSAGRGRFRRFASAPKAGIYFAVLKVDGKTYRKKFEVKQP